MDDAGRQAREVQIQRNALGDALGKVADTLELELAENDLRTVQSQQYEAAVGEIADQVKLVAERERAIMAAAADASVVLGQPVSTADLKDFEAVDRSMRSITSAAESLNERQRHYLQVTSQLPEVVDSYEFLATPSKLEANPRYVDQLNHLLGDFASINQQLRELKRQKIELKEHQAELEEYVVALEDSKDMINTLNVRIANLTGYYDVLRDRLEKCRDKPAEDTPSTDVRAQVVKIDHEYNYLIIDLGSKDHLSPNTLLNIGRDRGLICKVTVTRVMDEYAVCEVLPEFRLSTVKGD